MLDLIQKTDWQNIGAFIGVLIALGGLCWLGWWQSLKVMVRAQDKSLEQRFGSFREHVDSQIKTITDKYSEEVKSLRDEIRTARREAAAVKDALADFKTHVAETHPKKEDWVNHSVRMSSILDETKAMYREILQRITGTNQ